MQVRIKLSLGILAVLLLANSLLALVNVWHVTDVWMSEVQTRVRLDLSSAHRAYENYVQNQARYLSGAALDQRLPTALLEGDRTALAGWVGRVYRSAGMDFVTVLDSRGRVLYRARNPEQQGDDLSDAPIVRRVLRTRQPVAGTVLFSADRLTREGRDLAERAVREFSSPAVRGSPTPHSSDRRSPEMGAAPQETSGPEARRGQETRAERDEGMAAVAAVPIVDANGQLAGILYGGDLLNRRPELVDAIRDEVFARQGQDQPSPGTVTIFQGDLRIATNVLQEDGSRAVGTRMSDAVRQEVLDRGGVWAAPAFVVNDWYITAYEPIRDPEGRVIGALYVGLLRAPFVRQLNLVTAVFLGTLAVATLASLLLLLYFTAVVLRPIERIVAMARRVIAGDLAARTGIRPPGEMGDLCRAIDGMADAVAQRDEELKRSTRQQIGRAEKLASIGRLAAGVAHEINNPLTSVLTFAHLLRDKPNMDDQDRQDLDLVIHETTRAGEIVRGLLDFARERPVMKGPLDVNEVIQRTVRLIGNQKSFEKIQIETDLPANLPEVEGDMNQLQQVMLNLSLNACEAMPGGGTLAIQTRAEDGAVRIRLSDTGHGIKPEHLDKIFEPFFSTKPAGKGTGLGLSVSYGIIDQHGGSFEVESTPGRGTTFIVTLPVKGKDE